MAAKYSDATIAAMIDERKLLPTDYMMQIRLKSKRGHKECELDVTGSQGRKYRLILRENALNALDFSIILAFCIPKSNILFRLSRYNGKSHEHTNKIESQTFYDFHIHMATERYQELGMREDAFAKPTSNYGDFNGALECLFADCGFVYPKDDQGNLFEGRQT